jgi:Predicted ATPase
MTLHPHPLVNCIVCMLQENAAASIFTGDEEIFAFDRTVSRLSEMQTTEYWELWERHR